MRACVWVYIRAYVYGRVCSCVYARMYVHVCVWAYVCMCVRANECAYVYGRAHERGSGDGNGWCVCGCMRVYVCVGECMCGCVSVQMYECVDV